MSPANIVPKMTGIEKDKQDLKGNTLQIRDLSCPSLNVIDRYNPVMGFEFAPFYTSSNKKLCVPEFSGVDVYNLSTKQKVAHFTPLDSSIVTSGPLFSSPSQIFVGCSNGLLYFWDVETQKVTQKWDLHCTIIQVSTSPASPNKLFVLVKYADDEEVWVLEPSTPDSHSQVTIQEHPAFMSLKDQNLSFLGCISVRGASCLFVHRSLSSLGAVLLRQNSKDNGNILILDFLLYKTQYAPYKLDRPNMMVSVFAFHPSLPQVAFGSKKSPIFLANLSRPKEDVRQLETLPVKLHWHSLGPSTLQYSPDGLSLLSGGNEAVLVTWNLDTTENSFIPRLRDSIRHITCAHNQSTYAVRFQDGSVALVDPTKSRVTHTWKGLCKENTGFVPSINPDTKYLVCPGTAGSVSFYDYKQRQVVSELSPIKVNRVTDEEASPSIDVVATSPTGAWMIISTSISSKIINPEIRFQFWSRNSKASYDLSSEIWEAHPAPLISATFSTDGSLASLSRDGTLKIWALDTSSTELSSWSCVFQNTRSNSEPRSLCYSQDGSLLCVVYDDKLALWDPSTLSLQQYFAYPLAGEFHQASFVQGTPFLVVIGKEALVVFNLLSGTIMWSSQICPSPKILITDPVSSTFSVLGPQDLLLTFAPSSPSPLYATKLPFTATAALSIDSDDFSFDQRDVLLLSRDSELATLSAQEKFTSNTLESESSIENVDSLPWQFQPLSIHESDQNSHISDSKSSSKSGFTGFGLGEDFNRALQIPAHVAPPVNQIVNDFIFSILKPLETEAAKPKADSQTSLDLKNHQLHPNFVPISLPPQPQSSSVDAQLLTPEALLQESSKLMNHSDLFNDNSN